MFLHHRFILEEHHVALESAVRNHWLGQDARLACLYECAIAQLNATNQPVAKRIFLSMLRDPQVTVSTATDEDNGVYVQLARQTSNPIKTLITVGQKWAVENPPSLGNTPTKIW